MSDKIKIIVGGVELGSVNVSGVERVDVERRCDGHDLVFRGTDGGPVPPASIAINFSGSALPPAHGFASCVTVPETSGALVWVDDPADDGSRVGKVEVLSSFEEWLAMFGFPLAQTTDEAFHAWRDRLDDDEGEP